MHKLVEAFEHGNYALVAISGDPNQWQTYAAMGLLGKTQDAVEGLSQFNHEEARFYQAVSHWINGDEESAIRLLQTISTPHAQNLLRLILKPQIQVLSQLVAIRALWTTHQGSSDPKFRLHNVYASPSMRNAPYADIHQSYDPHDPPDFYIGNIGWELIPPNLQELPCPILGQTADHVIQIQTLNPWYELFDELLVNDPSEWEDIRKLMNVPVSNFPKLHNLGISTNLPTVPTASRENDVFVSGMWSHPYQPDKAVLLHQLLSIPDCKVLAINGYTAPEAYNRLLGNSKISIGSVRYAGGIPSRGLDALAMGCALLVQKGCVLSFYAGEEEGLLTYGDQKNDLTDSVRKILDHWPEFEQRARRGAEKIRQEFSFPRLESQYLRFVTFLAARPRKERTKIPVERLTQKHNFLVTNIPYAPLREKSEQRWASVLPTVESPHLFIDLAREVVMELTLARVNGDSKMDEALLPKAIGLYREGIRKFPRSLVLRFNLIRTFLHFGHSEERSEAIRLMQEVLDLPSSNWRVDPLEDVFPFDFCNTFFNYREYINIVIESLSQKSNREGDFIRLITASLYYYFGRVSSRTDGTDGIDGLEKATQLDPMFPFYQLVYAQALLKQGDSTKAFQGLMPLAQESMLFAEAYGLLKQIEVLDPTKTELLRDATLQFKRELFRYVQSVEYWTSADLELLPSEASSQAKVEVSGVPGASVPEVSIIVPVLNRPTLTRQCVNWILETSHGNNFEIIVVDQLASANFPTSLSSLTASSNVSIVRSAESFSFSKACNVGARVAKGKYLVFMQNDTLPRNGWLQALLEEARHHPEIGIVGSRVVTLDGRIDHAGMVFSRVYNAPNFAYRGMSETLEVANRRRELQGVIATGMLVRRDWFDAVGGFDEGYVNGCFDLCLKVRAKDGRVVYQPASVLIHLEHSGRYEGDVKDNARLLSVWKQKFLIDEDAFYCEDGYALRSYFQNGIPTYVLQPFDSEEQKRLWGIIADVERKGRTSGIRSIQPLLLAVQEWPSDVAALCWGAQLCVSAGIPEQEEAFWQRIVSIEESPEARKNLARLAAKRGALKEAEEHLEALSVLESK